MKKLFLILLSFFALTSYGQQETEKLKITENVSSLTAPNVNVQETDGVINYRPLSGLPISNPVRDSLSKKLNLPTGFLQGLQLSINADPTKYNIASGYYVVTDFTNLTNPVVKIINYPGATGLTPTYLASANSTYVALDKNMNVVSSVSPFTDAQRRTLAIIGNVVHSNNTTINVTNEIKAPIVAIGNQLHDFIKVIGFLNESGNVYSPNGANLQIDKSIGEIWGLGINSVNYLSPHKLSISGQTALTFAYRIRTGTQYTNTTSIDPNNYDNAGVLTAVPGGNRWTIQRINLFQSGLTRVQYGQTVYTSFNDAVTALPTQPFVTEQNIADNAIFRCYLIVKRGETNLTTAVAGGTAQFVPVDKFGNIIGNGSVALNYANVIAALGYTPENVANKQNSLAVDGTGQKYPTIDAVNEGLAIKEDKQAYIKYADNYANLTDAINATPSGGTLILGDHTYTGKISITRDNINIVGSNMPTYDSLTDKLIGGSIINGTFVIDGSNVSLRNIGVDSGTDQCIALNSGNPMEGLVMHDIAASNINTNNRAENVIAIVKANTTMHAVLLEGLGNSYFNNVHGKGGDFGVVLKISDSNASNIFGYESRTTNIYIKSDSYAPCLRSNFTNLYSISNVITASQPVAIHASTSNLFDVNASNINIYGGTRQLRLIASQSASPSYAMSNVNVSNATLENGVDVGLDTYGIVSNCNISNITVRNTLSGQGVYSHIDGRGINFENIRFDDNSGNNLDTAIDIRSYAVLNNIVSVRNADQTSLGGINLNNFANSSKIGIYVGNLKVNGVSVNRDKLTGQGTINFLPKYETSGIFKNSLFFDDALNAGINTTVPYSLGAGTSILSIQNTTGSGYATQVNNNSALVMRSNATLSALIETRNLPLVLNTNSLERIRVHASGGVSIGNATDPGVANLSVTGLAGTGARQVVASSTGVLSAGTAQPLKYTALISQTGTSAPTVTVLENTYSGAIVWTRSGAGAFTGTLSGAFTSNKTVMWISNTAGAISSFPSYIAGNTTGSINSVTFGTYIGSNPPVPTDGLITNASIKIETYP